MIRLSRQVVHFSSPCVVDRCAEACAARETSCTEYMWMPTSCFCWTGVQLLWRCVDDEPAEQVQHAAARVPMVSRCCHDPRSFEFAVPLLIEGVDRGQVVGWGGGVALPARRTAVRRASVGRSGPNVLKHSKPRHQLSLLGVFPARKGCPLGCLAPYSTMWVVAWGWRFMSCCLLA